MVIKYNNIFHSEAFQILPKLGFLVWKKHLATLACIIAHWSIVYFAQKFENYKKK
jgi:hypothetical protein